MFGRDDHSMTPKTLLRGELLRMIRLSSHFGLKFRFGGSENSHNRVSRIESRSRRRMTFSSDLKELVRSRTELVSLIAESLTLIPRSGHFVGLCPFHDDRNPSMVVYPDRQSFKCWSCQEGGDAFTWVMKRENLTFPEALKVLADRAHIELPKFSDKDAEDNRQKSNLYEVLKWAELQFHDYFLKSTDADAEVAREYVRKRGYTDETIKRFRLGYHPTDWEWIQKRAQKPKPAT